MPIGVPTSLHFWSVAVRQGERSLVCLVSPYGASGIFQMVCYKAVAPIGAYLGNVIKIAFRCEGVPHFKSAAHLRA